MYTNRLRANSFGGEARRYDAHRPRYPEQLVCDLLALGARRARRARRAHHAHGASRAHRILDVGAGTGIASEQFAAHGADVLAVEPDARMAAVAQEKGVPTEVGTFETWDPAGRTFDLVVFASSFHWVDPGVALPKVAEILRDGGHLALLWNRLTPTRPTRDDFAAIYRDYMDADDLPGDDNIDEIASAVGAAGYAVTQRSYPRHLHYSPQQWLDLAFTHSNHLTLAPNNAAELRTRLAERIGPDGVAVDANAVALVASPRATTTSPATDARERRTG